MGRRLGAGRAGCLAKLRPIVGSSQSSLILGVATALPRPFFEPFARSLSTTAYRGRFGIVLGQYSADAGRSIADLSDFVVAVDDKYDRVNSLLLGALRVTRNTRRVRRAYPALFAAAAARRERGSLSRWRALEYHLEGLQALRYNHYYDIVRRSDADYILLSDLRDVIFQRDPFDPPPCGLELFLEESHMTIHSEYFTHRWMRALYGATEVAALGDEVASCSGTVIGPRPDMLHYLKEMSQEIIWRRRPLGSHDQGVHNHLLRSGRFGTAVIVPNGHGRVLTMAGMPHVERATTGQVLNYDRSVPAILHQYDRHPQLAAELRASLGFQP